MENKSRKKTILMIIILAMVLLFAVVMAPPVLLYYSAHAFAIADAPENGSALPVSSGDYISQLTDQLDGDKINIVLLGLDGDKRRQERGDLCRPDTIMVASFQFHPPEVSLVNIPRDSYVKIYDPEGRARYDKINHSYMYGYRRAESNHDPHQSGLEYTLKTIIDFLGGVSIHGFVVLDMENAATIVDTMGGLYYDVEVEVRSHLGHGRLLVEKGKQHLDGQKLMDYVRNRAQYQGGESERIARQQDIMIALFKQFKQDGRLLDLPGFYRTVSQNIETNLSISQIGAMGILGMRVDPDEIKTYLFTGRGQLSYQNGQNIWYLVIDEEERVHIISEVFGVDVEKRPQLTLPGPSYPEPEAANDERKKDTDTNTGENMKDEDEPKIDSVDDSVDESGDEDEPNIDSGDESEPGGEEEPEKGSELQDSELNDRENNQEAEIID